jgi:glycosyltransferase involved in cell wall biosynthesis
LADQVKASTLLSRFPVTTIPNGLNPAIFAPRDKTVARNTLEIPPSARVILFGAATLQSRRKGFKLLVEALQTMIDVEDLWLLSFGGLGAPMESRIPHVHMGSIENERLLALIYSAADLFVIPSLEDNLPNTIMESMACGTPVIGFEAGGIPEMVRPGDTGLLAPVGNVSALRDAIAKLLGDRDTRHKLSRNCRRIVEQEYSSARQAERYTSLYREILAV